MKAVSWGIQVWLALLLITGLSGAQATPAMPAGKFACQVLVEGGKIGLVMVRADTRQVAERAVLGAEAMTTDDMRGRATGVVQCIRRGEESFTDYQFQQFYEAVPL